MKARSTFAVLSLAALSALPVLAQDKPQPPAAAPGGAEMEAMMKAMAPGDQHKHLGWMAGDWTFTNKMWMDPSQPPQEWSGTMHGELLMGGRYVQTDWKGNFMGMPFEGRGMDGYDNVTQKYFSTWMDNMSTGMTLFTGTCDDGGKKCEYKGDMTDPMTGKSSSTRSVITWLDDKSFKNEMYGPSPDGKEVKMMEISAKRK